LNSQELDGGVRDKVKELIAGLGEVMIKDTGYGPSIQNYSKLMTNRMK
jgi:hypothetical protein